MVLTALSNYARWLGKHTDCKKLRIMKLTSMLLVAACMQVAASEGQTVTLSVKDVPVKKVFRAIQKQTGLNIFVEESVLAKTPRVTLQVKDMPVDKVINLCLPAEDYTFNIVDGIMVIKEMTAADKADVPAAAPPPIDVHGRVVNDKDEPVEGVAVTVKGTRRGTTTDLNGEFTLRSVNENAVLVFSGINVETLEVAINGRSDMAVRLSTKISAMNDLMITASTGFQTISKERATGSYGVISKEQLELPSTNIGQRLVGTMSGLQSRLDVNGNPTFEIRGLTSLYANSQPLIVVDGFPIQGDFNSINPNDVESVTILKDAAAASIWGARSANGVIVITTKKAKKGVPMRVEFNAFTRIGKKFDLDYVRPLASSAETVEYEKLAYKNWRSLADPISLQSHVAWSWSQAGTAINEANYGNITAAQRDAILENLKTLDNKQQISDYLLANPVSTQYNISLMGASARMSNALSLMFEDNQFNFQESKNKKYTVNYRGGAEVFRWLDFNFGANAIYTKAKNSGVSLSDIQGLSPYDMLINPDGSYTNINQYYWPIVEKSVPMGKFPYANWQYNPVEEIRNRDLTTEQLNSRITGGLKFKIIKGLSLDTYGQYELFNTTNRGLYNENTFFVRRTINEASTWTQTTNAVATNLPKGSILTQNRSKIQNVNLRNQLNFNRVFSNEHEVTVLAAAEFANSVTESFGQPTTYGYNDQTLTVGSFPNGPGGTFFPIKNWLGSNQTFSYTNSFSYRTERYFSAFGNASYTYKRKYTASGSYRTEASNLITDDPKYRYAPFWSTGLAWHVDREDFMAAASFIDRLMLRATYGYTGNVDRSTSFRPLISTGGTPNVYTQEFVATVSSFGNPTLRWERTGEWNLAADYSMFKGKLSGKVEVYAKYGKDLIAQLSIPAINGTTSQRLNNAEMTNKGIELELGSILPISKNVSWRGNLNFSYNKNEITKLFVANYPASTLVGGGTNAYVVGANAYALWRFKYAGVINDQPRVFGADGATYDFGAFTPGDGRDYLRNMGTTVAPYVLGFMNSLQVYDFNLSFIVTGKFGHVFQRMGFNYPPTWTSRVLPNNKLSEVMNADPSKIVPFPYNPNEGRYYFWDRFHQYLDYLIEDASHLRMQELSLSYALPKHLLTRFNMSRLQLYAQGNDLFTIYWNKAKEDPEYPLGTMNPQPKLTFGLRCEF